MEQRKILFKAKRLDNNEWITEDLLQVSEKDVQIYNKDCGGSDHPVDLTTVCQFTGLKDREGNDIYEYDILQDIESKYKRMVLWGKETCGFVFARPNGAATTKPFRSCHVKFTRVVGNRFDRKEEK